MNPSAPMHAIEVKRLRRASSLLNVRRRNLRISITIPFSGDVGGAQNNLHSEVLPAHLTLVRLLRGQKQICVRERNIGMKVPASGYDLKARRPAATCNSCCL